MVTLLLRQRNGSSSSLGSSKEKDLPPVPNLDDFDDKTLLQSKSLGRKNFKKLSLDSSPTKTTPLLPIDDFESSNIKSIRSRRQRPPPALNLNRLSNTPLTLRKPAVDQELLNEKLTGLNLSNDKLASLDLSTDPNRRRQTVISSISPIKSRQTSPLDQASRVSSRSSSKPSTPQQLYAIQSLSIDNSFNSSTATLIKDNTDLVVLKDLGSGSSGTVSKVIHLPLQTIMAKKIIPIDSNNAVQTQILRELRILHECRSPYIIEFFGAFISNNSIVICMEYCNCGSLDKIVPLCSPKQFPLIVLKKLAFSVLSGLDYLYKNHKILHRDIKPSNVLMTHKGEFKLCDFGVSRQLTNSLTQADTFVGTSMYMSPERIQGMNYGIKSDVWSMGLLLIEIASGSPIWRDDDDEMSSGLFQGPEGILDLLQRIVNEKPPTLLGKKNPSTNKLYDTDLCEFIESCLAKDLNERKGPDQFLSEDNAFLKGVVEGIYDKDVKNWAKVIRKAHTSK